MTDIKKDRILAGYTDKFNSQDKETITQYISNAQAYDWMKEKIPYFECSDAATEETYYFRWWVYRKHIKKTPEGFIITEFLPGVNWAGAYNSINCAAGHHICEGRWLKNSNIYIEDYLRFWLSGSGDVRSYSTWIADALYQYSIARGDFTLAQELLGSLARNYECWEKTNLHTSGLFWSVDDRDAMEYSISGNGLRPTLNSYMYADACAISQIAGLCGDNKTKEVYSNKADVLKKLVQERLWDEESGFFKVFPIGSRDTEITDWSFSNVAAQRNVCEATGFIPWSFGMPDAGYERAWKYLCNTDGFKAPYGILTAQRNHKNFMEEHPEHECLWNGPSWPFATTQTLNALAVLLKDYKQDYVSKEDFATLFSQYTNSHYRINENGKKINWLDENIHPFTGRWLSRDILKGWGWRADKGGYERGKDYNHSAYADIIISKIFGVEPQDNETIRIRPMIPDNWKYACLEDLYCQGQKFSLYWDADGNRYGYGKGVHVLCNGKLYGMDAL